MIDLNDLRAFQRAGTLLSFSAAGRALGVRTSAVSRSIQRLEATLEIRLFDRNTRKVVLTEPGAAILAEIDDLATRLDRLVDLAGEYSEAPRGRLRISAVIGFGLEMLTDFIPQFSEAYPDISISLDLTNRVVDLIGEQVDIAFRTGSLEDSSLIVTRLGAIRCVLCASPDYLKRRGVPQSVYDLDDHDVLTMPRPDGLPRRQQLFHDDDTEHWVTPSTRITANDLHAICQMVVKGAGIAAMADFAVAGAISSSALVAVLPDWRPPPIEVSIVMSNSRIRSPSVRAFTDFIRERMANHKEWFLT